MSKRLSKFPVVTLIAGPGDAAGLPGLRFHDLRHTVITELAEMYHNPQRHFRAHTLRNTA